MSERIEFRDEDMRRAWEQSAREQRALEASPVRARRNRARLIRWVSERTDVGNQPQEQR